MKGLESITQKILDDANQKAKDIMDGAKSEVSRNSEKANIEIKAKIEEMRSEAERNAIIRSQRIIASTQLDCKKEFLCAKQQIIDTAFAKAISSLASLDDNEYDALIKKMASGVSGDISLIPRDKEKGTGGGFIAKNGKVEFNFSFDALARNVKERLEKDLVAILFD